MTEIRRADVCVMIAAFNEAVTIGRLVGQVREQGFSVTVVDDGSSDDTCTIAQTGGAVVLKTPKNQGKGSAIRRGLKWVLDQPFKAVILMDGDGQHDPKDLALFWESLKQDRYEMIVGDRMSQSKKMPLVRRFTNRFMSWLLSTIAGQHIPDTQCGYRAIKRHLLNQLSLDSDHFEIESEMILSAARLDFDIGSIPVTCVYGHEKSHIRPLQDTLRFLRFLCGHLYLWK